MIRGLVIFSVLDADDGDTRDFILDARITNAHSAGKMERIGY